MPSQQENIRLDAGQTFRLLRWQRTVAHVEVVLGPNRVVPLAGHGDHWHYHRFTELTFVKRGAGTRFVADHIELFDAGDLTLIGTNVPHYLHQNGDSAGISIQWEFPLEHGVWSFGESAPLHALAEAARYGLRVDGPTAEVTRRRMEALPGLEGLERLAAFLQILAGVAAAPARDVRRLATVPFSLSGSAAYQDSMQRAVSYILAHYREPVHLLELLRLVGMSRATFARQFRQHTGKSFATFLNQVRLQAVGRALRDTNEPVSNIALDHGFSQLSFFNRLFRREFGVTPTGFRRGTEGKRSAPAPSA